MKTIKKLLIILLLITVFPINVFASSNLTIGNKTYDKTIESTLSAIHGIKVISFTLRGSAAIFKSV